MSARTVGILGAGAAGAAAAHEDVALLTCPWVMGAEERLKCGVEHPQRGPLPGRPVQRTRQRDWRAAGPA